MLAFKIFFEFYWLFSFNSKIESVSKEMIPIIFTVFNYFTIFFTDFWPMFSNFFNPFYIGVKELRSKNSSFTKGKSICWCL